MTCLYCIIRLLRGQNNSGTKNKPSKVPFKGRITDGTGGLETDRSRRRLQATGVGFF
jgi:hypothetical protein